MDIIELIRNILVSNELKGISQVSAIIGGLFVFYQWQHNNRLKKADYINELTEKIRTDEMIKETIYMFDYDEDWYSEEFHLSGDLERKVDKTLSYFSYICYLKSRGVITKKELYFFQYELERILRNQQVQDYFYNLYHFSNKNGVPMTFKYLFEYGEKEKLFSKEMYLGCAAGVMVTASHNSAKYNGYKVYGADGCQITTEAAAEILAEIEKLDIFDDVKRISFEEGFEAGKISYISEEVYTAFIEEVKKESVLGDTQVNKDVAIVYSEGIDGLPKSDVLKFFLEDNCSIVVRPSGTEPKLKAYISVSAATKEEAQVVEGELARAVEEKM